MARFEVKITNTAKSDLLNLRDAIKETYLAPLTAKRYMADLNTKMQWLANGADYFPIVPELSYQYGYDIRRLNFKKMAILYYIEGSNVFVYRVIAQSLVIY